MKKLMEELYNKGEDLTLALNALHEKSNDLGISEEVALLIAKMGDVSHCISLARQAVDEKRYEITINTDEEDEFHILGAEFVQVSEMMDVLGIKVSESDAVRDAMQDGVEFICDMPCVPDYVYVDTPENRKFIVEALEKNPQYKMFGHDEDYQNKSYKYNSHGSDSKLNQYSGQAITSLEPLCKERYDFPTVGMMYVATLANGEVIDVFKDELELIQ